VPGESLHADWQALSERLGPQGYKDLRVRLVRLFEWRGQLEAEELADATIERLARKLGEGIGVDDVSAYALGIARLVHLEAVKRNVQTARKREALASMPGDGRDEHHEQRVSALQACLEGLPADERAIVVEYHRGRGNARIERRRALAERERLSLNGLRLRLFRLRQRLENCIGQKLAGA
jgi:DNA-directed RNA polymerase specialized sigma24 family protein